MINIKYLNATITLKDAFTSTLDKVIKSQKTFIEESRDVGRVLSKSYKLDGKDITNAIVDINKKIETNKQKLKDAQNYMSKWQRLVKDSEPRVKALSMDIQDLSLKKQKLTQTIDKLTASGNADTKMVEKLNNKINTLDKSIKDKTITLNKVRSEHKKYTQELRESEKEVSKLDISIGALTKQLNNLSKTKVNKKSFNLQDISNNINERYEKKDKEKEKYSGFDKLGNSVKGVGKSLSLGLSAPISVGIGASLKIGMDFESQMSAVEGTLGDKANEESMLMLAEKAKEMGRNTTKSATESAKAMEYMALAGWDTQQIIGGIEPILRLSEASGADLATTSDLVTDSMSALGLSVDDLSGFLDKVAKTSTSANTSAIQLMDAFIITGGKAKSLGADISEVSTILGLMANRGLKGSEAGRGLSAIITNLTSPVGQAKEALDVLNFSAFDSQGKFIGLEKTFKKLSQSLQGLTQEQRVNMMSMIAGKEHGKTLSAILDGLENEYSNLKNSVVNADGALTTMAQTMQDNTTGTLAGLKSKLEDVGIGIAQMLLPHLNNFINFLSSIIDKFSALSPATQRTIVTFGLFAVALPPIIIVIGSLITSIGTIAGGLSRLKGTLISATQGVGLLGKAFTFLSSNPIVLIIGAVVALVGAIAHLWATNEKFRTAIQNIWQGIVSSVEWATNKIIDGINWIINKINAIPFINIKAIGHVDWSSKDTPSATAKVDGSHSNGLDYVPYNGYIAQLHKGERVLTAEENKLYNSGYLVNRYNNTQKIESNINNSTIKRTLNNNSINTNAQDTTNTNANNININVNINYSDSNNEKLDINSMANNVANIIAKKIRMAKLNVI